LKFPLEKVLSPISPFEKVLSPISPFYKGGEGDLDEGYRNFWNY